MSRPINRQTSMKIYQTMIEFQNETDFSITYRELASRMGYTSYFWIFPHMNWLLENGYVKVWGKQTRAIPKEDKDE